MTAMRIGVIDQGGELYLNARDLITAMRDRAQRFDLMAQQPSEGWAPEVYQTACWAVAAELAERADTLDLECIARVNEERTSS